MTQVPILIPKNYIRLETEISVMIPSTKGLRTQRHISNAEMSQRVQEVQRYLSKTFGGHTSVSGTGGYVMKNGQLINENVVKVTSFGEMETAIRNKNKLIHKLQTLALKWGQESMGLIWETDLILVPRPKR